MKSVVQTDAPGWIKKKFHDFGMGEMFAPLAVNRLEEDDALLSQAVIDLHVLHHYPLIKTAGHIMQVVAAADQVTLADNIDFAVGGVVFSTHDQDSVFVIPDNSTVFLRAAVDPTCGDLVPCSTTTDGNLTPIARKLVCAFTLVEGAETDPEGIGGGPSSPTSMRVLKAVKGAAGTVPVVTLYANDGMNPNISSIADHEAKDPAHPASKISFDNTVAKLPGAPSRVQTAIEAVIAALMTVPYTVLDYPTVCTSDNRAGLTGQVASAGGHVTLPAGVTIVLGEDIGNGMGRMRTFTTALWQSADLDANSTYYVRGQIAADGSLLVYAAKGTDTDAIPESFKGTPGDGGGGFDSTVLDVLLAKVVTGAAGSAPTVINLANAKRLEVAVSATAGATISTNSDQIDTYTLNWSRRPAQCIIAGFKRAASEAAIGVDLYCMNVSRMNFQVGNSYVMNPSNLSVYKQVGYKVVAYA